MKIRYESTEHIYGAAVSFPSGVYDYVHYECRLQVTERKVDPVILTMKMVQPFPVYIHIPETYIIKGKSITKVYYKLHRFLKEHKIEFRG